MKKALAAVLLAVPMVAQKPFPVDTQVGVRITPKISGGPNKGSGSQTSWKQSGHFRRVVNDMQRNPLFAYEIDVVSIGGGTYQVTAKPASTEFIQSIQNGTARNLNANPDVPTLNSPSTMNCVAGQSVTLDLLYNPTTGQKITDTIQLIELNPDVRGALMDGILHFEKLEFKLNGENLTPKPLGGVGGRSVYIYVPAHGGFFFTLAQPQDFPQFQKVGYADGKNLKFVWANQSYEVISADPILSNAGSAEVWVFADPNFRPELGADAPSCGSSRTMTPFLKKEELEN